VNLANGRIVCTGRPGRVIRIGWTNHDTRAAGRTMLCSVVMPPNLDRLMRDHEAP
jgi:hypothetical protein